MNPEEARFFIGQLTDAIQVVSQSGEELPDELQGMLAQTLSRLYEISQEAPITPPIPELDNAPYESAQINAFKYDPKKQELYVKYQDKYPSQNGPVYKYSGVPSYIYNIFSRGGVAPITSGRNAWHEWKEGITPSLGAAANHLIKAAGFPYQRLS